jgi:hypothetical protein
MLGRPWFSPQFQDRDFWLFTEPDYIVVTLPQEPCDPTGRTVATPNPDELGRGATQHSQSVEVLIFAHQ